MKHPTNRFNKPAVMTLETTRSSHTRNKSKRSSLPTNVIARLAPVHSAQNARERLRATIQLASDLPVSEMPGWFAHNGYGINDSACLNVFFDICRRRWLEEDPEGLMEEGLNKNWTMFNDIAARWARLDPDRALAFVEGQEDPKIANKLQSAFLQGLVESRPSQALDLILQASKNQYFDASTALTSLAEHHPELLEATTSHWPSPLRENAETILTGTRLQKDFMSGLDHLLELPDAKVRFAKLIQNFQITRKLGNQFIDHLDQLPAEWIDVIAKDQSRTIFQTNPSRWLEADYASAGIDTNTADRLRKNALMVMRYSEPEKALTYLTDHPLDDQTFRYTYSQAVISLSEKDPAAAQAWFQQLPEDENGFKDKLEQQLDQKINQQGESDRFGSSFDKLLANPNDSNNARDLLNTLYRISENEGQNFAKRIQALPAAEQAQMAQSLVKTGNVSSIPTKLAADLILTAVNHPPTDEEQSTMSNWEKTNQ